MSSDFVLDWEKELGYKSDPFSDRIMEPSGSYLVNRAQEKEKLNWFFIKGYFYGSIVGEHGVGKTTLLKWLEERLTKYNRIHCIYINAAFFREQINIQQQILQPLLSFYEKTWSKPHTKSIGFNYVGFVRKKLGKKSIALLIDNGHNLTDRNIELLRSLREDGLRIHVITASTQSDFEKSRLQELGNDDLGINLRRLSLEESKEMVLKRIQNCGGKGLPFDEDTFKLLYDKADKNSRQLIHYCRDETIRSLLQMRSSISSNENTGNSKDHLKLSKKKIEHKPVLQRNQSHLSPPKMPSFSQTREEPQVSVHEQKKQGWKSPVRLKFDFGKKKNPGEPHMRSNSGIEHENHEPLVHDKRKLYSSEKYSQDLLNRLSSSKPKKKQGYNNQDFDDFINGLVK